MGIITVLLSIAALLLAGYTVYKTEKWKRRLKIEINSLIDDSHFFVSNLEQQDPQVLKEQMTHLNHKITYLLSIFPELATQWISINKNPDEWPIWEEKLQISMKKHRTDG